MVYDVYVKYEEAEIHRSATMQDFRDTQKKKKKFFLEKIEKKINGPLAAILIFFSEHKSEHNIIVREHSICVGKDNIIVREHNNYCVETK